MRTVFKLAAFGTILATSLLGCNQSQQSTLPNLVLAPSQNLSVVEDGHWLDQQTILLKIKPETKSLYLYSSQQPFELTDDGLSAIKLTVLSQDKVNNIPKHLADFTPVNAQLSASDAKTILKGSSLVVQLDAQNKPIHLSRLQTGFVLDDLYTQGAADADEVEQYGAVVSDSGVSFTLWAPTAKKVEVLLFDKNKQPLQPAVISMQEDTKTGVWTASGDKSLNRAFYQYRLTLWHPETNKIETLVTTDPYSLSLSTNSLHSQVIDLNDIDTAPKGWASHVVPDIAAPEDNILYELHIRDFSASDTALSNPVYRGKYKAFLEQDSHGIKHLKMLHKAGLNNIHLLPTFDIGTVNEDPELVMDLSDPLSKLCRIVPDHFICQSDYQPQQKLQDLLASYDPKGSDAQAVIEAQRGYDPYNWGYDPFHYTVPEGSYALNPDGESRIVEFREMVQRIHNMGFRVIMDVVYNHTYQAGLREKSVLDKIVPGYYYRKNPLTGSIEQSTCCDNTATERRMMAKLMTDSLVVWARDYKIDGFRFDLMGHQPKAAMLEAREAVRAVDVDTYFYGEGWNFGEVYNDAQFEQAAQVQLAGTEIGTFTDRMRDAIRGGAPFDGGDWIRRWQGVGNGLMTIPNDLQKDVDAQAEYDLSLDQVRVGLAGNLAKFPLQDHKGQLVTGADIDYGGAPTGYALDPADTVNYVSKHDNQSLWDNHQYRIAYHVSSQDRVRLQLLTIAYPLMSQGIPFLHMGQELLRSKSFLRDSYDYGDWFNAVDFSYQSNNYNVGLPPEVKDKENWPLISRLLEQNQGRDHVTPTQIEFSAKVFAEFIQIRMSSPLFRLRNAQDIIQRVSFLNAGIDQQIGLIAMLLDDSDQTKDLDPNHEQILVLFNNSAEPKTVSLDAKGFALHPAQASGVDSVVKQTKVTSKNITVPALTVAVLVK
ncbi:DUF3372 domain-containing protein [Saccharobesus litoralis]|uniref:DUF3372 domain-containing protein n=1 Tax=Saccharobesus litoralis TaxID=2172099 RepID=A0A2S0VML8_9ALTE|nr:pullulanase-type alpha-1,6-glucosidase [Saccharobesus litoralis]AWB65445.1 DUF3372 domain-containing protein [Saccharobesus litoralis]